jgi:hypothetical protein
VPSAEADSQQETEDLDAGLKASSTQDFTASEFFSSLPDLMARPLTMGFPCTKQKSVS